MRRPDAHEQQKRPEGRLHRTHRTRQSQHPEHKPYIAHFAPAVENYDQAAVKAELIRRGYKPTPDSKYGWSIHDPAGMRVEVAGKGLPEHVAGDCNGGNAQCPGGPDK